MGHRSLWRLCTFVIKHQILYSWIQVSVQTFLMKIILVVPMKLPLPEYSDKWSASESARDCWDFGHLSWMGAEYFTNSCEYEKFLARWVQRLLTIYNKHRRVLTSKSHSTMLEHYWNDLWHRFIIIDEI